MNPQKLILFDVDKTLVDREPTSGISAYAAALSYAIKKVFDIEGNLDNINYHNRTDRWIITEILKTKGVNNTLITKGIENCMGIMVQHYEEHNLKHDLFLLSGVHETLEKLMKEEYLVGLVTGNIEGIARAKMQKCNINHYFVLGGFGNISTNRTDLVKEAILQAEHNFGFKFKNNVYLVGDTPLDILAGKEAGVITLGVATGVYSIEDLKKSGADYTFNDLKDSEQILNIIKSGSKNVTKG